MNFYKRNLVTEFTKVTWQNEIFVCLIKNFSSKLFKQINLPKRIIGLQNEWNDKSWFLNHESAFARSGLVSASVPVNFFLIISTKRSKRFTTKIRQLRQKSSKKTTNKTWQNWVLLLNPSKIIIVQTKPIHQSL